MNRFVFRNNNKYNHVIYKFDNKTDFEEGLARLLKFKKSVMIYAKGALTNEQLMFIQTYSNTYEWKDKIKSGDYFIISQENELSKMNEHHVINRIDNILKTAKEIKEISGIKPMIDKNKKLYSSEERKLINEGSVAQAASKLGRTQAAIRWQRWNERKKNKTIIPSTDVNILYKPPVHDYQYTISKNDGQALNFNGKIRIKHNNNILEFENVPSKIKIKDIEIEFLAI